MRSPNRLWIAYAAMTSLFVACYWPFHIVRYNLEDFSAKANAEWAIALFLLADWIVLLLFSVVVIENSVVPWDEADYGVRIPWSRETKMIPERKCLCNVR